MKQANSIPYQVTHSDEFIKMLLATITLYFYIAMEADREEIVYNLDAIIRMIMVKKEALQILVAKAFIRVDVDGTCWLTDYK